MQILNIQANIVPLYKRKTFLPAGEYIRVVSGATKEARKLLPFQAVILNGRFSWLLPAEDWIIKEITGDTVRYRHERPKEHFNTLNLQDRMNETPLRKWQRIFLWDVLSTLSLGYCYKKGLLVGLGGGKTLATLLLQELSFLMLYICPKHIMVGVEREAKKWGLRVPIMVTPESCHKYFPAQVNSESSHKYSDTATNFSWDIVIVDEALSCKNPKAKRTEKVTELAKEVPIVVAMTGTPISAKRAPDLRWLRTVGSVVPAEEKHWMWRFGVDPYYLDLHELGVDRKDENGRTISPLQVKGWKVKEVAEFVSDSVRIVDIKEIMDEVPDATYEIIELKKPRFFSAILRGLLTQRSSSKRISQARSSTSGFTYMDDQSTCWLEKKTPAKIEWVQSFLKNNPEEAVVIFSAWPPEQERLMAELEEYSPALVNQNTKNLEPFLNGETRILICSSNITEGMNLQERSRIGIFLSNSTSPMKREQAEGRLYRQGQKKGVVFYDLVCSDTLDKKALELLKEYKEESESLIKARLKLELEKLSSKVKKGKGRGKNERV